MAGQSNKSDGVSRRRFLRLGLASGAVVAAGSVFAWHSVGYEVPADLARRLRALSPKEYLVVKALAARVLRSDADDLPAPEHVHVAEEIDGLVANLDDATRGDLKKVIHLLEHGLPWSCAYPSRFTRLSGEQQDKVLESMMTSRISLLRGAFDSLKSLCVMAYFRDERTWGAIGYDGPLVRRPSNGWVPLRYRRRA